VTVALGILQIIHAIRRVRVRRSLAASDPAAHREGAPCP
jgi:hypothetical protein